MILYLLWQISVVLRDAGEPCGVRSVCIYGGTSKGPQIKSLKAGVVRYSIISLKLNTKACIFSFFPIHTERPHKYELVSMLCLNPHVYYFDARQEDLKKEKERKGRKKKKKLEKKKKRSWRGEEKRREGKEGGGGAIQRFFLIHHKLSTM